MVSKTREKLIEVARQLFAYKGVENTTMNDIAAASDKGRRTIYTYFKNKREIYNAVLQRQSSAIIEKLREIVERQDDPRIKLRDYLTTRFDMIENQPRPKHDRYRTFFSRETRRNEKVVRLAFEKERELYEKLLAEGVEKGVFNPDNVKRLPLVASLLFTSLENILIHNQTEEYASSIEEIREAIVGCLCDDIIYKDRITETLILQPDETTRR